jgi:uncharacterized membrane protein
MTRWHWKRELWALAMIVAVALITLYFYPRLPDPIPSHYGFNGKADDFSAKDTFIITYLALCIGVYLLMTFIPLIDPFWKRFQNKYNIFLILRDCAMFFFLFFYVVILLSAKTGYLHDGIFGVGIGLFFVLLGNYLPRLPRNFFFGIRSPWTLASEEVWKRTHVLGGWLFVLAGLLMMLLCLAGLKMGTVLIFIIVPLLVFTGFVYPFWLYKKLQRENKLTAPQI